MIDRIRTLQGVATIVAALFATMVAWWNLGLPRLVFSPEAARSAGSPPDRSARAAQPRHPAPRARPGLVARQSARDALAGDGWGIRRAQWRKRWSANRSAAAGFEYGESHAGVQSIGSAVLDSTLGDHFELMAHQTLAANELTWFASKLVE
jgi:hypothetical protein